MVLLILENAGVDVSALVAGLGIGGVAVALAMQNILGDLFASLSITFDHPFVLGDLLFDSPTRLWDKGTYALVVRYDGGEAVLPIELR